jgi:hypothetical protein
MPEETEMLDKKTPIEYRNLTDLRNYAKKAGIGNTNRYQESELLEMMLRKGYAFAGQSEYEAASEEAEETKEPEVKTVPVNEVEAPSEDRVTQLTKKVNDLEQALKEARRELAEETKLVAAMHRPKPLAELLREQREQDAAKAGRNDAIARAQAEFLAGRAVKARAQQRQIMIDRVKAEK